MLQHRVIPCLLLQNGGLVKTRKFREPTYIGDPINGIRIFNEKEVDELIVLDIVASKNGSEPNFKLIEEFAGECFMPLCYGGGVTSLDHAKRLFKSGVEKLCVQTSALRNLSIVREIADSYGSQSIVLSMDIKKGLLGQYRLMSSASGKIMKIPWKEFLDSAIDAGAGEVLVNAVDKDGTLSGMDTVLIREASNECSVPLIAAGGAGNLQDLRLAVEAGASAIAAGAMFVFHGRHRAVLITYPEYNELKQLLDH